MKVLVAEDDPIFRRGIQKLLETEYELVIATNGEEAWHVLQADGAPRLALLDWVMPGLSGPELCRRVREMQRLAPVYLLLVTARQELSDIVAGFEAGADDYITKPFQVEELRSRLRVGKRMLRLHMELAAHVRDLQEALANVKQLQGLLPICSCCKRIRDDRNYWQQLEIYLSEHSGAVFSHGLCPECLERIAKADVEHVEG
jgi:DNA-binding response OmpR family regulator